MEEDVTTPAAPAADAAPETVTFTAEEWEAEISAAEQKGYLRGRNEQIEDLMATPGILENNAAKDGSGDNADDADDNPDTFLRYIRPSVWD